MSKSKRNKIKTNSKSSNIEELFLEDIQTADEIPIDYLPKDEPITKNMSYKNSSV